MSMKAREGLSLVEVLVAMTLLAVVLTSIAGMSFSAARQSTNVAGISYRQGVVMQEVNRMTAVPFTNLNSNAGCVNVPTGVFPHRRCVLVTGNSEQATVTIVVQPGVPGVPTDTVIFQRTRPPTGNPLNM